MYVLYFLCYHELVNKDLYIATPPHSAQLRGIPHHSPKLYIRVRAIVWACGRGQRDTQTRVTTIHFASSTTHANCNNQAYSEYKHVLANILRSLFVARTPAVEARSPDCRSNVENAPVGGGRARATSVAVPRAESLRRSSTAVVLNVARTLRQQVDRR